MKYDFDTLTDRRGTDSVKWQAYPEDVLPMWVADMDFRSPEPVIQALRERVAHGIFGYPRGIPELYEVVQARLERLYGWMVRREDLILVPGVVTGFDQACHAFGTPGGCVMVETPVYPPFLNAPQPAGMSRQDVELIYEPNGSYIIDFDAFEAAMTPSTRLFILCNPHNPVGRVFTRWELERMAEICLRHKVIIVSDEIHCDLVFPGHPHIPMASLDAEIAQYTITLIAPSKTYNIAGLECSFAIIQNEELRKAYIQGKKGLVGFVNVLGQAAALAAYRDGQEWLDQLLIYLETNRDCLFDFVQHELRGVKMARPEGTYLAWLDCREAGLKPDPYQFFLEKAGVALNPGETFGKGGEGFVRMNFGCPRSILFEGLERMRTALTNR